jgi:hypothetical protein
MNEIEVIVSAVTDVIDVKRTVFFVQVFFCSNLSTFQINNLYNKMGKGHYYENQNVKKQPKRTSKISVF